VLENTPSASVIKCAFNRHFLAHPILPGYQIIASESGLTKIHDLKCEEAKITAQDTHWMPQLQNSDLLMVIIIIIKCCC